MAGGWGKAELSEKSSAQIYSRSEKPLKQITGVKWLLFLQTVSSAQDWVSFWRKCYCKLLCCIQWKQD